MLALGLACLASACAGGGTEPHMRVEGSLFDNADFSSQGEQVFVADCRPLCQDFPAAPIVDNSGPTPVPADVAKRFGAADRFSGPGPCVLSPVLSEGEQPGALYPDNWLRPRFRYEPVADEALWEIRLSSPYEEHDLVAYTSARTWTLPKDIWLAIGRNLKDTAITVTIRGLGERSSMPSGTRGDFSIAPVGADGKLVYWSTRSSEVAPDSSQLSGFAVGDEASIDALTVPQVGDRGVTNEDGRSLRAGYGVEAGRVQCIGCHVSTPDGEAVAFVDHWPWNLIVASVQPGRAGQRPDYLSPGAERLLNQPWQGMPTFSEAHWSETRRILVTTYTPRNGADGVGFGGASYPSSADGLAWYNLATPMQWPSDPTQGDIQPQLNLAIAGAEGEAWGRLALAGETRSAASPAFSHDGSQIVYTAADFTRDGRIADDNREVDLHVVPFNDGAGGPVTPVAGASEPGVAEYYPALSPDDLLVAFNRVAPIDGAPLYYRPDGEIFVAPFGASADPTAVRLRANDPPACGGETSPGVINSWPKWSPSVGRVAGSIGEFGTGPRSYYFLIFSSARAYPGQFELPKNQYSPPDTRSSQLYVTAIVRDDISGELTSYPAIHLWNQAPDTSNLTPAWDEFDIPAVAGPL